jgi:SET domain-containing protein
MAAQPKPTTRKRASRKPAVWSEADFEVKPSSIPGIGMGLFAKHAIRKGDTIGPYEGRHLTDRQCHRKPWIDSHHLLHVCKDCTIYGENYTRYINHSDKPSVHFVVSTRWRTARVEALRNIRAGEELFLDYGPDFWEAHHESVK